jgi:hypothetical protein
MRFEVEVPDRVWWLLGGNAERSGKHIDELVQEAINTALGASAKRLQTARARQDRVVALALSGLTNAQIRERTGEDASFVSHALGAAGIKATKQKRARSVSSPSPEAHRRKITLYEAPVPMSMDREFWATCSLHQWHTPRSTDPGEVDGAIDGHLGIKVEPEEAS